MLVQLVTRAVRFGMIEQRVVVGMLAVADHDQAVQRRLGMLAGHDDG